MPSLKTCCGKHHIPARLFTFTSVHSDDGQVVRKRSYADHVKDENVWVGSVTVKDVLFDVKMFCNERELCCELSREGMTPIVATMIGDSKPFIQHVYFELSLGDRAEQVEITFKQGV
jgi:hypothetical protein